MNQWTGAYTTAIKEFAFLLRIDGTIHRYTQKWNIQGAQEAKRKKDWIEVEIGVPESSWQQDQGKNFKNYLVTEVEKGLKSMIGALKRNRCDIKEECLLADWDKIKREYLKKTP